nr:MAG TPA: hypothetical protein [Caudoviricetes sp.]
MIFFNIKLGKKFPKRLNNSKKHSIFAISKLNNNNSKFTVLWQQRNFRR